MGPTGAPICTISFIKSCCAEAGKFMRACGLRWELKKLISCWTTTFCATSLANCFPSLAISCLLEERYKKQPQTNASKIIKIKRPPQYHFEGECFFIRTRREKTLLS